MDGVGMGSLAGAGGEIQGLERQRLALQQLLQHGQDDWIDSQSMYLVHLSPDVRQAGRKGRVLTKRRIIMFVDILYQNIQKIMIQPGIGNQIASIMKMIYLLPGQWLRK